MSGKLLSLDHTLSCPNGGFPTIRHNELRDITANLLTEVCNNVAVEPQLTPLSGEKLPSSANSDDGARSDIVAMGFWGDRKQKAFFDVKVFNPFAQSFRNLPLDRCYDRCERQKKRAYGERIREIEHGCFTPLIFSVQGGMSQETSTMYKRLASLLATKKTQSYSKMINFIRCQIGFALIRSTIMCFRGSRSSKHHFINRSEIDSNYQLIISDSLI